MASMPRLKFTPEQYLARERRAKTKSEYYMGEVFAMAGGTESHNLISGNTLAGLHTQLRDRDCKVYPSDMRVKITATGLYTYPDVSVVCGEPEFDDDHRDTLLNPTVLFEVLSESTEAYDRGAKSRQYRTIPSLKEYVLISQNAHSVERYARQPDGQWALTDANGLDAEIELPSIGCTLKLAEIYDKVELEPPPEFNKDPFENVQTRRPQ